MVGILVSYWKPPFSGSMLVSGRVIFRAATESDPQATESDPSTAQIASVWETPRFADEKRLGDEWCWASSNRKYGRTRDRQLFNVYIYMFFFDWVLIRCFQQFVQYFERWACSPCNVSARLQRDNTTTLLGILYTFDQTKIHGKAVCTDLIRHA